MSAASPQTSRSGCRPIREASASRTAGWSSTITILARFLVWFRFMVFPYQSTRYQGAGWFSRLNGQPGANDRSTVPHDAYAQAAVVLGRLYGDADTVVLHIQYQKVTRPQGNADVLGLSMLDRVVDRFLGDEKEVRRVKVVRDGNRLGAVKLAGRLPLLLD